MWGESKRNACFSQFSGKLSKLSSRPHLLGPHQQHDAKIHDLATPFSKRPWKSTRFARGSRPPSKQYMAWNSEGELFFSGMREGGGEVESLYLLPWTQPHECTRYGCFPKTVTATSNLCSSRDKDPWGQLSSVPTPVSVHINYSKP